MHELRPTEGAVALLIDTEGRFLLQIRDDLPSVRYPGMVGMFGGQREGAETFLECVCREVHEEIGLRVPAPSFRRLGRVNYVHPDGVDANCEVFVAGGVPATELKITEGMLLIASRSQLPELVEQLTPTMRAALQMLAAAD